MKIKVYKVTCKDNTKYYYVDAPNKLIAKWCGANLYNHEFAAFKRSEDFIAERFHCNNA